MTTEVWTRISTEDGDHYDVLESYDTVMKMINEGGVFAEFSAKAQYRVSIKLRTINAVYEHGSEVLKRAWEFAKELDDLKKEVVGLEFD